MSREWKIGVATSIIGSVLMVMLVQPLMGLIWDFILSFGAKIHAGSVDTIYANAARGQRNIVGPFSLVTLALLCVAWVTFALPSTNVPLLKKLDRAAKGLVIGSLLGYGFWLPVVATVQVGIDELTSIFDQRMLILAPHLSDQEAKEWRARWALMNGRQSFQELSDALDARAQALNKTFPHRRFW